MRRNKGRGEFMGERGERQREGFDVRTGERLKLLVRRRIIEEALKLM